MFYIDFTAPDGNTYRIDLADNPITHVCPVCGEEQLYSFDETDIYYWCGSYRERRKEEEKKENEKKFWQNTIMQINKLCKSDIDIGTLDQWIAEAKGKNLSAAEEIDFYHEKIRQLRS